jgi:LAO/AO transport system kinase
MIGRMRREPQDLLTAFAQGDRRALAEILTAVEAGQTIDLPQVIRDKPPVILGITGSGGAGKSTLIAALIEHLRSLKLTVAVLACDPQSPLTGGAILGDRIRMRIDPADEGVFVRSLSTRGASGGISPAVTRGIDWLVAFGFDVIVVETVGVGQDQVGIRAAVDTLVLLVTPHTGDEVQWEKAGLIEVADIVVVNKSDLPGADRVRQQLLSALSLAPGTRQPPVLNTIGASGTGVPELWKAVLAHSAHSS